MHRTVRRAIIIGNGFAGAENQCYGLIRALGLSHRHSLYRVRRPKEGINKWLNWVPLSTHTRLHRIKSQLFDPHSIVSDQSDILEADPELIASKASETFGKYALFLSLFKVLLKFIIKITYGSKLLIFVFF
ncbi:putative mitochondrial fission protein ELM1 [Helianthus annuus]|nr:putative mitochondrial fission protein ELM1 [Helianthus annuus]